MKPILTIPLALITGVSLYVYNSPESEEMTPTEKVIVFQEEVKKTHGKPAQVYRDGRIENDIDAKDVLGEDLPPNTQVHTYGDTGYQIVRYSTTTGIGTTTADQEAIVWIKEVIGVGEGVPSELPRIVSNPNEP